MHKHPTHTHYHQTCNPLSSSFHSFPHLKTLPRRFYCFDLKARLPSSPDDPVSTRPGRIPPPSFARIHPAALWLTLNSRNPGAAFHPRGQGTSPLTGPGPDVNPAALHPRCRRCPSGLPLCAQCTTTSNPSAQLVNLRSSHSFSATNTTTHTHTHTPTTLPANPPPSPWPRNPQS